MHLEAYKIHLIEQAGMKPRIVCPHLVLDMILTLAGLLTWGAAELAQEQLTQVIHSLIYSGQVFPHLSLLLSLLIH